MKKLSISDGIAILISLLPMVYLSLVWNNLPPTVPVHYGADLQPDRMGDKQELWFITGVMAMAATFAYFLLNNIHRIDPKRKGLSPSSTFNRLAMGLVVFMSAINIIIVASAKGSVDLQNFLFPLLGLLFAFVGNYMNNIKPNYFAGIRLPWTLSSDENWRRTHHLAGKLWFVAGVILPPASFFPLFIVLIMVMILVPAIYSYRIYRQQTP